MAERALPLSKPLDQWQARLHAAQLIQRRSSASTLQGLGIYLTLTLALLVASLVLHNMLRFTSQNLVMVMRQPLFIPLFIAIVLTSFYLAMISAIAVAREKEQGTLEVLLYGPVDETSFMLGQFLAQVRVYLGVVLVIFVWSNLVTWLLNLKFEWELAVMLFFTIATAAAAISFSLLVAAWSGGTRAALFYFVLIFLLLVAVQVADEVVSTIAVQSGGGRNDPLLLIRNALGYFTGILTWISPYAQLRPALDALLARDTPGFLLRLGVTLGQAIIMLLASIAVLRRRGVRA
jgi:ABC-type transport system involved in multi-copper enzyme maturation permease subunit